MKVLIVDDSIVFRTAITQALKEVPGIEIFKAVSNGKIAIDFLKQNPDISLITLDMEMPVMDGLETIKTIRTFNKDVTIIVFSSFTVRGAEKTIDALNAGADDFVPKVEGKGDIDESIQMIRSELLQKIQGFKNRFNKQDKVVVPEIKREVSLNKKKSVSTIVEEMTVKPKLILIGSSTGGPEALTTVFKSLKSENSVPILVVQHMPPLFTDKLANMLDRNSVINIKEAQAGDKIQSGHCYIAPGDYHMVLEKDLTISLKQTEKVCFVRPAVDVLFDSVAQNFSDQVLYIILTGMGEDGTNGARKLAAKGCYQFIQNKETSVVWGMPGSISRAGLGATELSIEQFGQLIDEISKRI